MSTDEGYPKGQYSTGQNEGTREEGPHFYLHATMAPDARLIVADINPNVWALHEPSSKCVHIVVEDILRR